MVTKTDYCKERDYREQLYETTGLELYREISRNQDKYINCGYQETVDNQRTINL